MQSSARFRHLNDEPKFSFVNDSTSKNFVAERVALDATDLRILAELQQDASRANQELAARVHVSAATCLRRVRRLEETGVIRRRVALLEPALLGHPLQAICEVTLDRQGLEHVLAFEARAVAHAAVQQCYRVSPGPDLILVMVARDMPAWTQVVAELFTQDANVRNLKAFFVLQRAKFDTAWPLPAI
jgi:Lrp/AsnC family transcriptional regulator, leucine-responsive regulatory protein